MIEATVSLLSQLAMQLAMSTRRALMSTAPAQELLKKKGYLV